MTAKSTLQILALFAVAAALTVNCFAQNTNRRENTRPSPQKYPSSHYYNADGSFNEKAAKDAYAELFRYHRYSLSRAVLENIADVSLAGDKLWILDFGLGDFSNAGMAGIFFVNDKEHGYFGHEIYLLPYQMIPEHFHLPAEDKPAKHEAWQVRNGSIWCFAEGGSEADLKNYPPEVAKAMKSQLDAKAITAFKGIERKVGEMAVLSGLEAPHFMMAGPEGAIVTEYATFHSGSGLRFTNPSGFAGNTEAKK
ncbi:hypothetical protein AGMMS50229_18980 [Campylobacterota bacterium]|nr:hypothetical protein AGMMS50229_18980 [Campylobacterota bacterium]